MSYYFFNVHITSTFFVWKQHHSGCVLHHLDYYLAASSELSMRPVCNVIVSVNVIIAVVSPHTEVAPFRRVSLVSWCIHEFGLKISTTKEMTKIQPHEARDQREWVFEVREVKSENKKLSLFFEKCKVKKKAITLFQEVKSEIKMLRDREVKILENC